jgi:hypothetical protein
MIGLTAKVLIYIGEADIGTDSDQAMRIIADIEGDAPKCSDELKPKEKSLEAHWKCP